MSERIHRVKPWWLRVMVFGAFLICIPAILLASLLNAAGVAVWERLCEELDYFNDGSFMHDARIILGREKK